MALLTALTCLTVAACGGGGGSAADEPITDATLVAQATPPRTAAGAPSGPATFAVAADAVSDIARPFGTRHEALAEGVPLSFDWAQASRLGRGHAVPAGFGAITGWGQVFWQAGATTTSHAAEIRAHQTYVCSGPTRQWSRLQQGSVEGAAFRPDFAGNESVPANVLTAADGQVRVTFPAARAFHYWPRQGRAALASETLCGVLVLFQARAVAGDGAALPATATPPLLIGAGADYWTTTTAAWNQYQTNQDVGIGQLRRLTPVWRWYGLNTAETADLQRLQREGYVDRSTP